jgi:hypothetical protein
MRNTKYYLSISIGKEYKNNETDLSVNEVG